MVTNSTIELVIIKLSYAALPFVHHASPSILIEVCQLKKAVEVFTAMHPLFDLMSYILTTDENGAPLFE